MNGINRVFKFIIFNLLAFLLLSGCDQQPQTTAPTSQAAIVPTQALSPTQEISEVTSKGHQPITPDNIQDLELITELGTGNAYDVTLSPDGKTIAALTRYKIILYDRETFQEKLSFPVRHTDYALPSIITYSPDGNQIIYPTSFTINFVDAKTGEFNNSFVVNMDFQIIEQISFTQNQDRLIIKGSGVVPGCGGTINYALYTFDGIKLYDQRVCSQASTLVYIPIDNNQSLFFSGNLYVEAFPYEMSLIDNESGNVVAAIYNHKKQMNSPIIKTTFGNTNVLPSYEQTYVLLDEKNAEQHIRLPIGCFANDDYPHLYKILYEDESSLLLALKYQWDILISEIDLTTCQTRQVPLLVSESYNQGNFSPDDRYFVFSNSRKTMLLNLEENTYLHSEGLEYLELNQAEYTFNSDGTKLLLYFNPNTSFPRYNQLTGSPVGILDTKSGETIGTLTIPEKTKLSITPTFNPEVMIISYRNRVTLWNIETQQYIGEIPKGSILQDPSRNGLWVLSSDGHAYRTPELYDLSSGVLVKQFFHIKPYKKTEISLIENNSILEISFDGKRAKRDYIHIDIETGKLMEYQFHETAPEVRHYPYTHSTELPQWFYDEAGNANQQSTNKVVGPFLMGPSIQTSGLGNTYEYIVWNLETDEFLGFFRTDFAIKDFIISPNHNYLAAIGSDGIIRIFGVKENQ